jgi:hypothetical protein
VSRFEATVTALLGSLLERVASASPGSRKMDANGLGNEHHRSLTYSANHYPVHLGFLAK